MITKGSWTISYKTGTVFIIPFDRHRKPIAEIITNPNTFEEDRANAQAIATLPDLIEASKNLLGRYRAIQRSLRHVNASFYRAWMSDELPDDMQAALTKAGIMGKPTWKQLKNGGKRFKLERILSCCDCPYTRR